MTHVETRMFADPLDSLDAMFAEAWTQLETAANASSHPWRFPTFATVEDGCPRARIVVLRGADRATRTLWCHTDRRSTKIADVLATPVVSWLFYDDDSRVQASVHAVATVHTDDDVAQAVWDAERPESLRCYLAPEPPGLLVDEPTVNLPPEMVDRVPTIEEAIAGREQFAVIRTTVTSIELLFLRRTGNVRARFTRQDDHWQHTWVTP